MMAEKKKKKRRVKICFLLGTDRHVTENKTSRILFFSVLSAIIKIAKPPGRLLEKKPQQQ
jgi:hypothetical protein